MFETYSDVQPYMNAEEIEKVNYGVLFDSETLQYELIWLQWKLGPYRDIQ